MAADGGEQSGCRFFGVVAAEQECRPTGCVGVLLPDYCDVAAEPLLDTVDCMRVDPPRSGRNGHYDAVAGKAADAIEFAHRESGT